MKVARVRVSPSLLLEALNLPADTVITDAKVDPLTMTIVFTASQSGLQDQPEGAVGEADPELTKDADGTIRFIGWGQR